MVEYSKGDKINIELNVGQKRARKVTKDLLDLSSLFLDKQPKQAKRRKTANSETAEFDDTALNGNNCPYLGQIQRHMLDFDFHKQCSVTISTLNVYCCLVCGKYFQGKGQGTPAFMHSLQPSHQDKATTDASHSGANHT